MARYPLAISAPLPGIGAYTAGPFKIVHHTTQGSTAAGAIATYKTTKNYPHFTVDGDAVYQHVDTNIAVTGLEHPPGTVETNRSRAIQIELVGYAERPKSRASLRTMAALCRWLETEHGIPQVWPNGLPYPPVAGREPNVQFDRDAATWQTKGGHYGHCHVPNNHHWDPGYTAEEVALVMGGVPATIAAVDASALETEAMPRMAAAEAAPARPAAAAQDLTDYVAKLVAVARGEYAAYHGIVETDEPLRSRIDTYCRGIGIEPPANISAFAWSATFVSWCIKTAGATARDFTFSAAHAVFVRAAIANADAQAGVFRARRIEDYGPRVGDLIHRNRSGGAITYAQAKTRSDYPSHSAIVVEVGEDRTGHYALTIGGNEHDSVRETRVALNAAGLVVQQPANPFICVVQDLKVDVAAPAGIVAAAAATSTQRLTMAAIIVDFEARRDAQHRLMVYDLPPDDGGGRYEVAGINERYNKTVCDELVALVRGGHQDEAEHRAAAFIAENTDVAAGWTSNPAIEFYLRDCVFNRGTGGAAWIVQKAVGVETDRVVGSHTLGTIARAEMRPIALLDDLRQAREAFERLHRDETSRFWVGLVNRWNKALKAARTFLPGNADAVSEPEPGSSAGGSSQNMVESGSPLSEPRPSGSSPDDAASAFDPPPFGDGDGAPADDPSPEPPEAPHEPETSPHPDGSGSASDFDPPDAKTAEAAPVESPSFRPAVAAAAVLRGAPPVAPHLVEFHRHLESRLFSKKPAEAFSAEAVAPTSRGDTIVGVGIGAAHRDFESVGAGGPGAAVLNVYVSEAIGMEAVKRILVDHYGMSALVSDAYPVNVHHSGPIEALSHKHPERPSPCGISVGHYAITAGTQGALARATSPDRQRRLLMLSNNHVLANENDCRAGDAIHQPGPFDMAASASTIVGVLERWTTIDFGDGAENYVDCATAWCWPERVRKEFIRPNAGLWDYFTVGASPVDAAPDMPVGKSGRTTQLTSGRVVDVNASISVSYGNGKTANFKDQVTVTGQDGQAFSDGGDSGSLIWTFNDARAPVGLLFAGGRDYTFANKIDHVLKALEIELFT